MLQRNRGSWCAIGALMCCMGMAASANAQSAFISEIFFNPPSGDNGFEALEITGTPGMSLDGWTFAIIDGDGTSAGLVNLSISLNGMTIGANGVLLIRDAATDLAPPPAKGTSVAVFDFNPDIQNGSQTLVLGMGTFPAGDLDTNNDGALDVSLKGFTVVDAVGYTDTATGDQEYGDDVGFTNLGNANAHALYRVLNSSNGPHSWAGGQLTGANPGPYNWNATFSFGWAAVGVPDPSVRTLDLGTLNYVFETTGSGACCFPSGSCSILTAADCGTQGGTYQGDNTDCGAVNCPQPTGACCFFDSTCAISTEILCVAQGGTFQGANTTCSPSPCPQPSGACCLGDGSCAVLTVADCAAAGGAFAGENVACDSIPPCAPANPGDLYLSEIFFNSPGGDNGNEGLEIVGPANFNLDGWFFLVIESDGTSATGAGVLDQKVSLRGMSTGSNGILLIRDSGTELLPAPAAGTNVVVMDFAPDIENGANTFVLGYGRLDPVVGTDLDTDNSGSIDIPLGAFTRVDAVAYGDPSNPPSFQYAGEFGGENLGDVTMLPPGALYRIIDSTFQPHSWAGGFTTGTSPGPFNWSATSHFGWGAVGVVDPSTRTLDLGTLNFIFDEVTGGCCTPDGGCVVISAIGCKDLGGNYQGDNTSCAPPCPVACPCDFNSDDVLNSQDFFDFLSCFFVAECLDADFNNDKFINSQDFFDFLSCFFAPPPGC